MYQTENGGWRRLTFAELGRASVYMVAGMQPVAMCGGCLVARSGSDSDSNSPEVQSRAAPLVAKRVVQSLWGLPVCNDGGRALRLRVAFWESHGSVVRNSVFNRRLELAP